MGTSLIAALVVLFASFIGSFGAILLKKGSESFSISIRGVLGNRSLMAGVLIYGVSSVMFIGALRYGELTVLYPLVATNYVWVSLLSTKFLNEGMNAKKWAGIALILIGVTLIGIGS